MTTHFVPHMFATYTQMKCRFLLPHSKKSVEIPSFGTLVGLIAFIVCCILTSSIEKQDALLLQRRCHAFMFESGSDPDTDLDQDSDPDKWHILCIAEHLVFLCPACHCQWYKVRYTDIAIRSLSCHTTMGTHMPHGITQCYLPPDRTEVTSRLYHSRSWYSIKRPQSYARLS